MRNMNWKCALALGLAFCATQSAKAGSLAITVTSGSRGTETVNTIRTAGWAFTTSAPLVITALDDFAATAGGNFVRLYDSSRTVLASATVHSTDPLVGPVVGSPGLQYNSFAITPVLLPAGSYFIAAESSVGQPYEFNATISTIAGVTYKNGVGVFGVNHPNAELPLGVATLFDPSYFGPSFEVANPADSSPLPLPSTACMGLGLLGTLGILRSSRKKTRPTL
jgi:hypothetical protein